MKNLLLILIAFLSVSVQAQTNEPEEGTKVAVKAKITFDNENHDFGKIIEGTKAKHVFTFVNNSSEPVTIVNAKASCGCTVPSYSKEPVMPGSEGSITAVFDSSGKGGQNFAKSITVETSAGTFYLNIKGTVVQPEVKPKSPVQLDN